MIIEYGKKAIERAEYKKLVDGSWFTEIPGFQGVWANGDSVEQCRNELVTVLEEWLLFTEGSGLAITHSICMVLYDCKT